MRIAGVSVLAVETYVVTSDVVQKMKDAVPLKEISAVQRATSVVVVTR